MRWIVLAVLFIARACLALSFQVLGAVAPLAGPALDLDHAAMGALIGIYWLPGIVLALPAGLLGRRFGFKWPALAGLLVIVAGGELLALAQGYGGAAAARLFGGCGNAVLSVLVSAMVAAWFRDRELATAMGIVFISWPFGLAASLAAFPAIAEAAGDWRSAVHAADLAGAAAALLLALIYREPPGEVATGAPRHIPPRHIGLRPGLSLAGLGVPLLAAVLWTTYNAGQIIVMTYAPPMLAATARLPLAAASRTVSLAVWATMASTLAGGLLADRSGRLMPPIALGTLGAGVAGVALAAGAPAIPACLPFGIFAGLPAGALLALPARSAPPGQVGRALGCFMTAYYALLTPAQLSAGWVREASAGDAATVLYGALLVAATAAGLPPMARAIRRAERRRSALLQGMSAG